MKLKNKGFTLIEVLVLLALIVTCLIFLGNLVSCTSDEQPRAAAAERQEEAPSAPIEVAQNDTPAEPEKPAGPQYETITTHHFTSSSETHSIDCTEAGKDEACGISYESCGSKGEDAYYCQTGVHAWTTEKQQLVKDN